MRQGTKRMRMLSVLLALILVLGLLPTAAFAEGEPTDESSITGDIFFCVYNVDDSRVTFLPDAQYRATVRLTNSSSTDETGLKLSFYQTKDGTKTQVGDSQDGISVSKNFGGKNGTEDCYFDWTPDTAGAYTLECVVSRQDGTVLDTATKAVTVLERAPENYIPIHEKFENTKKDASSSFLNGWKIDGAEIVGSVITSTENETTGHVNRTIEVLLSHNTQADSTLTIYPDISGSPSGLFVLLSPDKTTPQQAASDARANCENGIAVQLVDGTKEMPLYLFHAYDTYTTVLQTIMKGGKPTVYTFKFSTAEVDTSNDPKPEDVTAIAITTQPAKTVYTAGTKFDRAGMVVTATLKSGETMPVAGYLCSPSDALSLGNTEVTISFGDATATVPVTVVPDTTISDVEVINGQSVGDLVFNIGVVKRLENTFRAITLYGEENGQFTFKVKEGTEVYIGDEKQTVAEDGTCTISIPTSTAYDPYEDIDGETTIVRVQGAGEYSETYTDYTFICYEQIYSGMPTKVVDYLCIGSQYTNGNGLGPYGLNGVSTLRGVNVGTTTGDITTGPASLGNFGGYITYYYEEPITDDPKNPYGVDMIISGNSYNATPGFAEPGQVWVSEDGESWYALAGCRHYDDLCNWNYAVTYKKDMSWEDSLGNSGTGRTYYWPLKEYYPLYDWPEEEIEELTLSGIYLEAADGVNEYGNTLPPAVTFGYVDCAYYGTSNIATNPYVQEGRRVEAFDLAWAVDADGQPVDVSEKEFHYVKVQTASHIVNSAIGEKSTEVNLMRTAEPATDEVGKTAAPDGIKVDGKALTLVDGQNVYEAEVAGGFNVEVEASGDANIYINSVYGNLASFYQMPAHKMVRIIVQEGEKEPVIYYINLTESAEAPVTTTLTLDANGGLVGGEIIGNSGMQGGAESMQLTFDEGMIGAIFPTPYLYGYTFLGWSYGQKIYSAYTAELPDGATLTASWRRNADTPADPEEKITVSFRLIGSTLAGQDIDLSNGNYNKAKYVTWIATQSYSLPADATVLDLFELALNSANISWENPSGSYITSITAPAVCGGYRLAEFTNGNRSGWMYTINGDHALFSVSEQKLSEGDRIIFHYVNDYAYEVHDWDKLGGDGFPALGDSTYHSKWLEAADVNPSGGAVADPDEDAAREVIALIDAIGTVTKDSGGKIQAARTAYDGLTAAQKKLVTNYDKLTAAEKDYAKLTGSLPFTDVSGHWALDAVRYVYENDLMNGVGDGRFNPDGTLNRAMLATILYRLEGEPAVTGRNPYSDVAGGQWYTDAIVWASENGIVNGVGEGKFAPTANITRQQLATMLYRYAQYKQYDTGKAADLSGYTDAASAGEWAVAALRWAVAEGLITGRTATTIAPAGTATRAEAATILQRYLEGLAA